MVRELSKKALVFLKIKRINFLYLDDICELFDIFGGLLVDPTLSTM